MFTVIKTINMMPAEEKTHTNELANYRSKKKKAHKYT